jgi:hypothetical protein
VADSYITLEPFSEDFFQGSQGVIDRMAKRIVESLEAEW